MLFYLLRWSIDHNKSLGWNSHLFILMRLNQPLILIMGLKEQMVLPQKTFTVFSIGIVTAWKMAWVPIEIICIFNVQLHPMKNMPLGTFIFEPAFVLIDTIWLTWVHTHILLVFQPLFYFSVLFVDSTLYHIHFI